MSAMIYMAMWEEAAVMAESPLGEEMARRCVLDRSGLIDAVSTTLAAKLAPHDFPGRHDGSTGGPQVPELRCRQEKELRRTIIEAISE